MKLTFCVVLALLISFTCLTPGYTSEVKYKIEVYLGTKQTYYTYSKVDIKEGYYFIYWPTTIDNKKVGEELLVPIMFTVITRII